MYYLIYLSVWKCPPGSSITEDQPPALCRPLHWGYHLLDPYFAPSYNKYVRPVVVLADPYVAKGKSGFDAHVYPYVDTVQGSVDRLLSPVRSKLVIYYSKHLEPLVNRTRGLYQTKVAPVFEFVYEISQYTFHSYLHPAWTRSLPYIEKSRRTVNQRLVPYCVRVSTKVIKFVQLYSVKAWTWISSTVSPKVSSVYHKQVEPQLIKIHDRILQTESYSDIFNGAYDVAGEATLIPVAEVEPSQSSILPPVEGEVTPTDSSLASSSIVVAEETADFEKETVPTPVSIVMEEHGKLESVSEELKLWKELVEYTTTDAFNTFVEDVESEKKSLLDSISPEFMSLLRDLQGAERDAIIELNNLITSIENSRTLNDEDSHNVVESDQGVDEQENAEEEQEEEVVVETESESIDSEQEKVQEEEGNEFTAEMMNVRFKEEADKIRVAASAIRKRAEVFAENVVNSTEQLRRNTVDVLDEFSEIVLQEIGRTMVSIDAIQKTSVSIKETGIPNWKDWKEFRSLKEQLLNARQRLLEYEINMDEVNKVIRGTQETANYFAREAAQSLRGLRYRSDFVFQQRALEKDNRLEEQANFELEEDEDYEETITITSTRFVTMSRPTDSAEESRYTILPVEEIVVEDESASEDAKSEFEKHADHGEL